MNCPKPGARLETPTAHTPPTDKPGMHPRNAHRGRYDFAQLILALPELATFVAKNAYGNESIDFANPNAVKALNAALLKQVYGVSGWDIPAQYLCPPIPGRADYIHHVADLLGGCNKGCIPRGGAVRVLDIGVGANCVYPLIGHSCYGWRFVGTEIDPNALANAQRILDANSTFSAAIDLRRQNSSSSIFSGILQKDEVFDLSLCNPPFHASLSEAAAGSQRKWRNLGKMKAAEQAPKLNFGGQDTELSCPGGEASFIARMIEESAKSPLSCFWYTTLVSKASNLPAIYRALQKVNAKDVRTLAMEHGQKQSRVVAWTFFDESQKWAWREQRWNATRAPE